MTHARGSFAWSSVISPCRVPRLASWFVLLRRSAGCPIPAFFARVGISAPTLPLLCGSVSFRRGRAAEQACSAKVFVDIGPVDAVASSRDFPIVALCGCGIEQARVPGEWHAEDASVAQRHAECIVIEFNIEYPFVSRYRRRTHAMPPGILQRSPSRLIVLCGVRGRESRNLWPVVQDSARTWPRVRRDRRGCEVVRSAHGCKNKSGTHPSAIPWACAGF